MSSKKYYIVWKGLHPGIYETWDECKKQVFGFEGAVYKSFKTKDEAEAAFTTVHSHKPLAKGNKATKSVTSKSGVNKIIQNSLSVDAACSGNPGKMEYRGVHVETGEVWFLMQFPLGTNNIGEFLAIVHGLAELKKRGMNIPVYTDSSTALAWIRKKKCGTKLPLTEETKPLFDLVARAEKWLMENIWQQPLLKWDTQNWGEIPADFGRK